MFLSFRTDMPGQTAQTLIRLQSDHQTAPTAPRGAV